MTVDASVCGQTRKVAWDDVEGLLTIEGIHNFPEAMKVLDALAAGEVFEINPERAFASEETATADREAKVAYQETKGAVERGEVPLAAPSTRPIEHHLVQDHIVLAAAKEDAAQLPKGAAPVGTPAQSPTVPKMTTMAPGGLATAGSIGEGSRPKAAAGDGTRTATTSRQADVAPSATTSTPEMAGKDDLGAFANMQKLAEVVVEIRRRGHESYEAIRAYCEKLQGIGDVCPPLDQIGARLEERLKVHLSRLGIQTPA